MRDAGPIRSGHYPNGSDKLITLVHKLKTPYRNGAVWVMNKTPRPCGLYGAKQSIKMITAGVITKASWSLHLKGIALPQCASHKLLMKFAPSSILA